jgi:uncharacterized protein HemX
LAHVVVVVVVAAAAAVVAVGHQQGERSTREKTYRTRVGVISRKCS